MIIMPGHDYDAFLGGSNMEKHGVPNMNVRDLESQDYSNGKKNY